MSRVQPPATPLPFATPFAAKTPGAGQVVSVGAMKLSIAKGLFANALLNAVPCAFVPEHVCVSGGTVRFTSTCCRQLHGEPFWSTCVQVAAVAFERPFTPSQPPYRLSK